MDEAVPSAGEELRITNRLGVARSYHPHGAANQLVHRTLRAPL